MEKTNNRNPNLGAPNNTGMTKTLREIIHGEHDETDIPVKVSLMALMADDYQMEEEEEEEEEERKEGNSEGEFASACCVCMVRNKGAAFIPCGHAFCRLCSRELWASRRSCPLCNGFILDILDIF
ncbi:probable E3 ubiquitin-protein ligase LUL4 [Phalaenopsis equestris]|uniref:probable E3 ubiquitin-protein ligase LUL4 n=1 Tax=Phalaenopsis equestris TaxID=78828 RepID=UPI0009E1AE26|nr:probable E3 ubiquitin-protein ligase LUL4 [Phalaenopsis equestris]